MNKIIELLARNVIAGKISLEDIGNHFNMRERTKKRIEEIKAEEA